MSLSAVRTRRCIVILMVTNSKMVSGRMGEAEIGLRMVVKIRRRAMELGRWMLRRFGGKTRNEDWGKKIADCQGEQFLWFLITVSLF